MNIAAYIDHTLLKPAILSADIEQLCREAFEYKFAAVCVPPPFVKRCNTILAPTEVKVATVIGFPFGYSVMEAKLAETVMAVVDGAHELDMVINLVALKNADWQYLETEVAHVLEVVRSKGRVLKVIIESGILTEEEIIKCCGLYARAGVDFVKTSTGYAEKGASVEAVQLINEFNQNDSAANARYLGRVVAVSGLVKQVEKDEEGKYTVVLGDTADMSSVRCALDSTHAAGATGLRRGEPVKVKGSFTGFKKDDTGLLGSDVELNRAVVIKDK